MARTSKCPSGQPPECDQRYDDPDDRDERQLLRLVELRAWCIIMPLAVARFSGATLPRSLDWAAIAGMAPLKGIGFTVAIFIANLAFDDEALQAEATLAILVASLLAGLIGVGALLLRHYLMQSGPPESQRGRKGGAPKNG